MRAFDDERIGRRRLRLMYDTPSITQVCYRLLVTPVAAVLGILVTVWVVHDTVRADAGVAWAALGFLPLALLTTLLFAARVRAQALGSREAGATTTSGIEEGFANIASGPEPRRPRAASASVSRSRAGLLQRVPALRLHADPRDRVRAVPAAALTSYAFIRITDLVIEGSLTAGDFALIFAYFSDRRLRAGARPALDPAARLRRRHRPRLRADGLATRAGCAGRAGAPRACARGVRNRRRPLPLPRRHARAARRQLRSARRAAHALRRPRRQRQDHARFAGARFHSPSAGRVCIDGVDIEASAWRRCARTSPSCSRRRRSSTRASARTCDWRRPDADRRRAGRRGAPRRPPTASCGRCPPAMRRGSGAEAASFSLSLPPRGPRRHDRALARLPPPSPRRVASPAGLPPPPSGRRRGAPALPSASVRRRAAPVRRFFAACSSSPARLSLPRRR